MTKLSLWKYEFTINIYDYINMQHTIACSYKKTLYCTSVLKGALWGDWEDSDTQTGNGAEEEHRNTTPLFPF